MAYSDDAKHIVTASGDRGITIRDARSGEIILERDEESSSSVAFRPGDKRFVTGMSDGTAPMERTTKPP